MLNSSHIKYFRKHFFFQGETSRHKMSFGANCMGTRESFHRSETAVPL